MTGVSRGVRPAALARSRLLGWAWTRLATTAPCWVAGGFVRDRLLGRTSRDLDLTIDADVSSAEAPARRIAAALGVRPHLLGRPPLAVWRISSPALTVELWPLGDIGLEDDLLRRDFTVNAMAWRLPRGPLVDLVGGVDDLRAGRLRGVRASNLRDDPVRAVRAARFLAELEGLELDRQTADWIRAAAPGVAAAPPERVGQELQRLLAGPAASRGIRALAELGLLAPAAPDPARSDAVWLVERATAADLLARPSRHPLRAAARVAGDAARLALLARSWRCTDDGELAAYAWPRTARRAAVAAAAALDPGTHTVRSSSAADRRELLWRLGDAAPAFVALGAAIDSAGGADLSPWRRLWRLWRRHRRTFVDPEPLLTAAEVQRLLGLPAPGPELGAALSRLERAHARGELRSPEAARRLLRNPL